MDIAFKIWRQKSKDTKGKFETYRVDDLNEDMSLLEALDVLNERLLHEGDDPVSFSHDCREGICGSCGIFINGHAHSPLKGITACQLHMRHLKKSKKIVIEPWRAKPFPIIKDLVVDRSALDRILQSGGYISINTGGVPDANATLIGRHTADDAFVAANCIGCGACAASCPNASAMLFVAAKVSHLAMLPQGNPEKHHRALKMIETMDAEGFGNCSNTAVCEAECPKGISLKHIAKMNREYFTATMVAHIEEHPSFPYHGKSDDDPHLGHPEISHQIHHEEK